MTSKKIVILAITQIILGTLLIYFAFVVTATPTLKCAVYIPQTWPCEQPPMPSSLKIFFISIVATGFIFIIAGIGLFFKKHWARILSKVAWISAGIFALIILGLYVNDKYINPPQVVDIAIPIPENTLVAKGWLEGTMGNWTVAETTKSLSGYSGRRLALNFSDESNCVVYSEKMDYKTFPCSSKNPPANWGYGDRVRIYGAITSKGIEVSKMEIVSSLPVNNW